MYFVTQRLGKGVEVILLQELLRLRRQHLNRVTAMAEPPNDLRDRIASVIEAQHVSEFQGGIHPEDVLRLADAVIAELNLQRASRPNDYGHVDYPPGDRYITKWIEADDE